ncbi:MAG TPA: CvpA family protein [Cytophagaceae bacterium]|jgi:membrane protein required for colicin V production|nr:CvpA family protein [Cytophagaceae bacterium]
MEIVDIVLFLLAAVAAWFGYKKGFLIELLSLFAIILAFAVAWKLSHTAVLYMSHSLEWNPKIVGAVAFILILILVFYIAYWISKLLSDIVHQTPFGVFDKTFGAIVSVFKWFFMLSLMLWALDTAQVQWYVNIKRTSIALPYCERIAPVVFEWVRIAVPFEDIFGQMKRSFE